MAAGTRIERQRQGRGTARRQRRGGPPSAAEASRSLEDVVLGAWAGLREDGVAGCPVCGEKLHIDGCVACGSELA